MTDSFADKVRAVRARKDELETAKQQKMDERNRAEHQALGRYPHLVDALWRMVQSLADSSELKAGKRKKGNNRFPSVDLCIYDPESKSSQAHWSDQHWAESWFGPPRCIASMVNIVVIESKMQIEVPSGYRSARLSLGYAGINERPDEQIVAQIRKEMEGAILEYLSSLK